MAASIANKKFGLATVKHSGCGVVATYNAMITLGDPKPFDDILNYYNSNPSYRPFWGAGWNVPSSCRILFHKQWI